MFTPSDDDENRDIIIIAIIIIIIIIIIISCCSSSSDVSHMILASHVNDSETGENRKTTGREFLSKLTW